MQYNVTIKGTHTLLLHKYTAATASNPKVRLTTTKDSANYADEWVKTTYLNKEGQVIMPWTNLFACMFEGSKGMKIGKTAVTRIVYTSLAITTQEPLITLDKEPITIDMIKENDWLHTSGVVITGRRIDRVRAAVPAGYEISFGIKPKVNNRLTTEDIGAILDNAGQNAGLGDWRPSAPKKPGPYGTFEVIKFEEVE